MKYSEFVSQIFQSNFERLKPFHSLLKNHKAVIAYSGGKDSSLLAHFYQYLFLNSYCPEPILFHLNHLIRDNFLQEEEIHLEMKNFSSQTFLKKKIFPNFQNV